MGLDMTSFDAALKVHYTQDAVEDMVYTNNPFLALCPKMEKFGGKNLPVPIVYGNPQGRSKTFSNAQTRSSTTTLVDDFVLTRKKDYAVATIDNEALEASKGDADAFLDAATTEIDGALNALTNSIAMNVFRGTDASIGQVLAAPSNSSTTFNITLKDIQEIANYEVNMVIVIYSAKTGGSVRTSDGSDDEWVISAINRNTGVLTVLGNKDGSSTIAADDYIFVEGDRGLGVSGLEDWLPSSAPSSTAFYGVDRSVDTVRLGGNRLDASTLPIEEALIEADAMVDREGHSMDHIFLNSKKFGDLKKSLGSKVQYVDLQANARISFRGIVVDGCKGPIKVLSDRSCPNARGFGLKMSMVKLYTLGKMVRITDTDGLKLLRQASADGVEFRARFYGNLAVRGPGACINVQF